MMETMMSKLVQVSNDVESGFYLDGQLVCQCEPDELEVILKSLGFEFEFMEDFAVDQFPATLEEF
jgi:hypothetical protein